MITILVPTDFSKNANNALDYAVSMAKKEKAKVLLLHAFNIIYISPDVPLEYFAAQLAATELEAARILNALCDKVRKKEKVECEFVNHEGDVIDVILDTIKRRKPDLIVMGTKGASGIKEVLMGSNTVKVISRASCPVIAVPEKASFDGIKKVVYATDYHASDIPDLKKLVDITRVFNAGIKVLHIADERYTPESAEGNMKDFAKKVDAKVKYEKISYQLLYAKAIEKKLEQYVKEESVNLLVISTRYRSLVERLFDKSLTAKLAYHTKVPLMAFHYKQSPVGA